MGFKDINVNAIAPGYLISEVTAGIRAIQSAIRPFLTGFRRKMGESGRFKGTVVFLASEAANYMHGATIPVDGGWLAR